ncbi:MAG TPA: hypothetical protein VF701_15980 [Thermoanaerobaculia bacterium]
MKPLFILLTLVPLACASAPGSGGAAQPEIELVQLSGPEEQNYPSGEIEIQFGLRIANRSSETITLRQIQLESVTDGGPYQLERETYYFQVAVEPERHNDLTFWAHAVAGGDRHAVDARAPITVRVVTFFESAAGNFRKVFIKRLAQGAGTSGW